MPLPQMPRLPNINGDKNEKNRILKNVEQPEEDRDVVTKEFADATYVSI